MESFEHVKVGDIVHRILAGRPMQLIVGHIADGIIHTGSVDSAGGIDIFWQEGWKFRVDNGREVDEELGWDGIHSYGSFLTNDPEKYKETAEKQRLQKEAFIYAIQNGKGDPAKIKILMEKYIRDNGEKEAEN